MKKFGTKQEVWEGQAEMTAGKLMKKDLTKSARGKICSIKQQEHGKRLLSGLGTSQNVVNAQNAPSGCECKSKSKKGCKKKKDDQSIP